MTTITQLREHRYDVADSFVRSVDAGEDAVRDELAQLGFLAETAAGALGPGTLVECDVSTLPRYGDGTTVRFTISGRGRTAQARERLLDAWPRFSAAAIAHARRLLAAAEDATADRTQERPRRLRVAASA